MSAAEQQELKRAVKEAVKEAMVENSEMLKDLLIEVLEDTALLQRIEEGRKSELVNREQVMELLEPKH
ncbi:MAG: hypothetical protein WD468_04870 [Pirellulales bacterium]